MKKFFAILLFSLTGITLNAQYRGLWFEATQYYTLGSATVTYWGDDTLTSPQMVRDWIDYYFINKTVDSALYADVADSARISATSYYSLETEYSDSAGFADTSFYALTYTKDSVFDEFTIGKGFIDTLIIDTDTIINRNSYKKIVEGLDYDSLSVKGYKIYFNESEGVFEMQTAKSGVVWQGALEDLAVFYNATGSTIDNCTPISFAGTVTGDSIPNGIPTLVSNAQLADAYYGLSTTEVLPGDWGFVTERGLVRECNTSVLDTVELWAGEGIVIDSAAAYPSKKVFVGIKIKDGVTDGIIYSYPNQSFRRIFQTRDYSFTTTGLGNGTYYRGGFYRAPAASVTLTQASPTQTYGSANVAYSAHGFVVCGGTGTVDAGQIGLRITGSSINDDGVVVASDADTIITDITTTALNDFFEGKKFNGIITFELITISGTPTTYSLTINYGYAKYEDAGNRNFYVTGTECVGLAGANDTGFNIELLKHDPNGWTYNASAFVPGGNIIASLITDIPTKNDIANATPFAWKRSGLSELVNGAIANEGVIYRITTTQNSSVATMDLHLVIALESDD